jgi:DNA processing protein
MEFRIEKIGPDLYPAGLLEIPDMPSSLYSVGAPLATDGIYLAVVGSRAHTSYGQDACRKLILGLAGYNITIVSGLALGIDSIAHRAALEAGLPTIAFPGSGLRESAIYPATNLSLAKEILAHGGTLVSEFEPSFKAAPWAFPRRNRLMAGICQALLVIEAEEKSGTLITARLALDYNKDVLAVPGPITSKNSSGTNRLIKEGATPITTSFDILQALGFKTETHTQTLPLVELTREERILMDFLREPATRDDVAHHLEKPIEEINGILTALEIKGLIKEEYGEIRQIS